jgi:RNA polymerase sigma-70 factor (ECF subfamily)
MGTKKLQADSDLILQLQQGDRKAFERIYGRYAAELIDFAAGRAEYLEDARDMVQDIFISLWSNRETLQITSLPAYLYGAVRYKLIDHIRRNIRQERYSAHAQLLYPDTDNSTLDDILYEDMDHFVISEAEKLPPRMREVFLLSRKRRLNIKEISSEMQISEQTVKNQLYSALKALRPLKDKILSVLLTSLF